jgi:hypothetical protein
VNVGRLLRYLGSARNIAGASLALVGLVLHFVGLLGILWIAVVPALYLIGALLAPSPRPALVAADDPFDAEKIRRALDGTCDMGRGRLPADVQARIVEIRERVVELLPHAADLPGGAQDLYVLQRTARDYLPETLRIYLALPPDYATTRVVQDGKTSLDVLRDQLELLDAQMAEIADAVHKRDSDRLLAQGRFLEERFGRPGTELKLPPER